MLTPLHVGEAQPAQQTSDKDWPMLAHDLARSNATPHQLDPGSVPFPGQPVWVRDFASGDEESSELVFNQYQPIVVGKLVYVGTSRNNMYALDTESGAIAWVYSGGEPGTIMASPSVVDGVLYYAATNGHVYALNAATGSLIWDREIIRLGGFRTSPAVYDGSIYLGGEDGVFYALNTGDGRSLWTYDTGGPILSTAAIDAQRGRIYFANEDLYGFALDLSGNLVWKSAKFHGISTRRFFPVIVDDGDAVIFRTSPGAAARALNGGDTLMARTAGLAVPDDFTHINHGDHGADIYASYNAAGFAAEQDAIADWLTNAHPEYETLYVLNTNDGDKRFVTAALWSGGSGQVGEPPVVSADGTVYVRARSYYSNFDSTDIVYHFGTPATLDLNTGRLQLLRLPADNDAWTTGIFIIGDEASALSLAGNRLYFYSHGDAVGSVLTLGQDASRLTSTRDIPHTISSEERDPALPFGQDALAHIRFKGGAGGGSSLFGQPVVIADDKVFFVSQGMIGMYRSNFDGTTNYIADSRGSQPSVGSIAVPPASALEAYVTQIEDHAANLSAAPDVVAELETEIADFVSGDRYQPFIELAGKKAGSIYFRDPTEEAYILALAYPYLSAGLQQQVRSHFQALWTAYPDPLHAATSYSDLSGRRRERYSINNDAGQNAVAKGSQTATEAQDRLYHLWGYAYYTGDWEFIANYWDSIRDTAHSINPTEIGSGSLPNRSINHRVASLTGYTRMADHLRSAHPGNQAYQNEYNWALGAATTALRARLQWEEDYRPTGSPWSQQWIQERGGDSVFMDTRWGTGGQISRYNGLVPAIARALRDHAWEDMLLQNAFVDVVVPAQHLAWSFIPNRGEIFSNLLPQSREVFLAKALVMEENADTLLDYLSYPWCKGDLYYIERLAYIIRALQPAPSSKSVSSAFADYGDIVTYTISVVGTGASMTVTDRLPDGVTYVNDSATREPQVGDLTASSDEIGWTGTLTKDTPLLITFGVEVVTTQPVAVTNIAIVDDGVTSREYPVTLIANGHKIYLPLIMKNAP
jgi:uncharacterized repeat protein (TIGR01451 family)